MDRFYIEQKNDRFYDTLKAAKDAARRLSRKMDDGVYVMIERYDPQLRDYMVIGSVSFFSGTIDTIEGELA